MSSGLSSYKDFIEKAEEHAVPLGCLFELTYKCNLNCVQCYIPKDAKKELEKERIFGILDQLEKAGCLFLTFSGGEILTRQDFFEIAKYAKTRRFVLRFFTNATLINSKIADKIEALRPVSVETSLYGHRKTHDKTTRVRGSFDRAVNAIKMLKKRDVRILVKMLLMKHNAGEFWELKKTVEDLGAEMRGFGAGLLITPSADGKNDSLKYRLDDEQLKKYIQEESNQMKFSGRKNKFTKIGDNDILCNSGRLTVNITPYGEVNPCVEIRLQDNSLKDRTFMDIWTNHKDFIRIRQLRLRDTVECRQCNLVSYCFLCPGLFLVERGSIKKPSRESCRIARIRKEVYGDPIGTHMTNISTCR